jgi:hypothetical protein
MRAWKKLKMMQKSTPREMCSRQTRFITAACKYFLNNLAFLRQAADLSGSLLYLVVRQVYCDNWNYAFEKLRREKVDPFQ